LGSDHFQLPGRWRRQTKLVFYVGRRIVGHPSPLIAIECEKCPAATAQRRYLPVAPMMAMPVMTTPAPVTVMPTPMAMVVPAPMMAMSPPHLLRLEPFDLLTRCHGWFGIRFIFN
jgi:hypothetical protein